ncbi:ABC transporter permease subunit/CPBP intramembrane protease [uncultured Gimesia sp.]|jgi:sodium transport system permease protein|uniref:ABC transporter permease subunit/CPBP intramembrane protease n=1 Tax=uncultured Gimesia sp. TaxID=1678688 RepID=UPI0026056DEA|nr:ABC transporter permease subunit/CPBP intramembrane protease [uncultured Gimesia sp.]
MIQWKNIKLILLRELKDQMRDRRTLFMVAVLPLLLYPAMGIGMVQMTVLFSEQPRNVVVLGASDLPKHPQLLEGDHFVSNWFRIPSDAEKLRVITDIEPVKKADAAADVSEDAQQKEILEQAHKLEVVLRKHQELLKQWKQIEDQEDLQQENLLAREITETNERLSKLFAESRIQVLILIPKGLSKEIELVSAKLARHEPIDFDPADSLRPLILENSADEKSMIAYRRVEEVMRSWEKAILRDRLSRANLPESLPTPINPDSIDLAQDEQLAANLWSKLFPALLIIMAATGAFYPAIDLGAGEKERGTMETLLISPAKRTEIVLGKFLTVLIFSISTALLNLASMGFTGRHMVNLAGSGALSKIGDLSFPSYSALFWIVVLLIPLSALFSALCLALATFARSSKEGQYYLTPLLMVTIGLTVFCLSPAVEINAFYSLMPVVGVALLLKGMLLSSVNAGILYVYAIPVLVTSVGYSLLALWWAIDQFQREDVLFREAERFEVGLWLRHLMRTKDALPSFAEAGFCFVIIMLLQFGVMNTMSQAIQMATDAERPLRMMQLLMIQQLAIIATPALMMGIMLTTSVRKTFRLYLPSLGFLGVGLLLPFVLHPLSLELASSLDWFFPALPAGTVAVLKSMSDPNQPIWLILMAFAFAPAVCEELAFRGFILSGFGRRGRAWLAIILSSVTFGAMHMIPQQVFNATLLGLALGLMAVHSRSLFPGVIFHFIYNSLSVLRGRIPETWVPENGLQHFVTMGPDGLRYSWPLLVISAVVAIVLLRWVVLQSNSRADQKSTSVESLTSSAFDRRLTDTK